VSNHLKDLKLKIWRQSGPAAKGHFEEYVMPEISDEASFLEMLDVLNEGLIGVAKVSVELVH
jgi:succinate dehydrogenase / fumarate reductase, iron-sulfur subunit